MSSSTTVPLVSAYRVGGAPCVTHHHITKLIGAEGHHYNIMTTSETTDVTAGRRAHTPNVDIAEAKRNFEYDMAKFLKYSSTQDINPDPAALAAFLNLRRPE